MKVMPATKWRGRFVVGGIAAMAAVSFNRHGVKFREAGEGKPPTISGTAEEGNRSPPLAEPATYTPKGVDIGGRDEGGQATGASPTLARPRSSGSCGRPSD
jgi:hypothetical protein